MKENPLITKIKHLVLLGDVFTLNGTTRNFVEFDGRLRKMDTSDSRPKPAKDDRLQEVCVVAVDVEGRSGRSRALRNKPNIGKCREEVDTQPRYIAHSCCGYEVLSKF